MPLTFKFGLQTDYKIKNNFYAWTLNFQIQWPCDKYFNNYFFKHDFLV